MKDMKDTDVDETLMGAMMAGVPVPLWWVADARRRLAKAAGKRSRRRKAVLGGVLADDIETAMDEWECGLVYFSNSHYRYRDDNRVTGWDKTARAVYRDSRGLAEAVRIRGQGVDDRPPIGYHYPSTIERARKSGMWRH